MQRTHDRVGVWVVDYQVSYRLCDASGEGKSHESDTVLKHQPYSDGRQQRYTEMVTNILPGEQRCAQSPVLRAVQIYLALSRGASFVEVKRFQPNTSALLCPALCRVVIC